MDRAETLQYLRERILAFAASRIGRQDAEDLAQEVFVVLLEKYTHIETLEDLVPLSIEIANLKMKGHIRKRIRRKEDQQVPIEEHDLPATTPNPHRLAAHREMLGQIKSALDQLPARCRELVRLKLEGWSFVEIAKRLDANVNTVYTWDRRCHERLRAVIRKQAGSSR